jgi:hypothetical protein
MTMFDNHCLSLVCKSSLYSQNGSGLTMRFFSISVVLCVQKFTSQLQKPNVWTVVGWDELGIDGRLQSTVNSFVVVCCLIEQGSDDQKPTKPPVFGTYGAYGAEAEAEA